MKRFLVIASLLTTAAFGQQVVTTVAVKNPLTGVSHFANYAQADAVLPLLAKIAPKPAGCGSACEAVFLSMVEWGIAVHVADESPVFLVTLSYRSSADSPERKQVIEAVPRIGPVTSRLLWIGRAADVSVSVVPHVSTGRELNASIK